MTERRSTVEEYIGFFPDDVRRIRTEIRRRILRVVPAAGETISYQVPTITLDGKHLVYFGSWKNHIALYPYDLIERLVVQLVRERG